MNVNLTYFYFLGREYQTFDTKIREDVSTFCWGNGKKYDKTGMIYVF